MPKVDMDLNPVDRLVVDAIGQPGSRVFYLQAQLLEQVVTILVEKIQVQTICVGVEQFLAEIVQKHPGIMPADGSYVEENMRITPPIDPIFRAGEIGLAYSEEEDLAILVVKEILTDQASEDDLGEIRFWCTRSQLAALGQWGIELSGRGRPICPQCGEPIPAEGHLCPKKNGHKK
jgi:uncharacterized repeat protein (TIGR03847 family)